MDAIAQFAGVHGLAVEDEAELRALTPALITGDRGWARSLVGGELAPGFEGKLFEHRFANGGAHRESAIVLAEVPESVAFVPALVCRDRAALGGANPAQLPAEQWAETKLESATFNRRYRLLALAGQDPGYVRELFSPQLIAWLADEAPAGLSFELNEGNLAIMMPGPLADAAAVEALCATAAELTARIRAEAAEEDLNPDLFDESAEIAAIEAAMTKVDFKRPPVSVPAAVTAYRNVAARTPRVLLNASFWSVLIGGVVALALAVIDFPLLALVAGVITAVAVFGVARLVSASRYHWGTASVSRVGLEAFVREYARKRKLELRDRWRFHADHRHLAVPGFADHVLYGLVPETEIEGLLVLFADAPEQRSEGEEIEYVADRPLASDALIVQLERPPAAEAVAALELPADWHAQLGGSDLIIWHPVPGNLTRTAKGLDEFRERAGEAVHILVA